MQARLPADLSPLLVVQFIDERHVRVFGRHSLFDAVMTRLGLRNSWQEQTNDWGFSVVSIEQFMTLPTARLVVVDPIPVGVSERLQEPGLWQHLPLVRQAPRAASACGLEFWWRIGRPPFRRSAQRCIAARCRAYGG